MDITNYYEHPRRNWYTDPIFNIEDNNFHRTKWLRPNYTHFWRKWCCFDCRVIGKLNEEYEGYFAMASKKICYSCNKDMVCVGSKFEAPPKKILSNGIN